MAGPVADSVPAEECWCGGSLWKHQYRRKRGGEPEPYCAAARAKTLENYHKYMNKPGVREEINRKRRLRRGGGTVVLTEEEERMA